MMNVAWNFIKRFVYYKSEGVFDESDGFMDGMKGIPDPTTSTEFWSKIWAEGISHSEGAS